jgi:hypothetical protein
MPRRSKGPRLWLQPARRAPDGRLLERPVWCIFDGKLKRSTGFGESEPVEAQKALAEYIIGKTTAPRDRDRDPASVRVADVISIYAVDIASKSSRLEEVAQRLEAILNFFGGEKTLADVNKSSCEAYVEWRIKQPRKRSQSTKPISTDTARRELEDLRAAIRHHWNAGLCSGLTPVVLPPKGEARERWLTRAEAARLLLAAWRMRQTWKGLPSDRTTGKHVARFMLTGLYTGTRAGAICAAALEPTIGAGLIDLDSGVFYRRPRGQNYCGSTRRRPRTRR